MRIDSQLLIQLCTFTQALPEPWGRSGKIVWICRCSTSIFCDSTFMYICSMWWMVSRSSANQTPTETKKELVWNKLKLRNTFFTRRIFRNSSPMRPGFDCVIFLDFCLGRTLTSWIERLHPSLASLFCAKVSRHRWYSFRKHFVLLEGFLFTNAKFWKYWTRYGGNEWIEQWWKTSWGDQIIDANRAPKASIMQKLYLFNWA